MRSSFLVRAGIVVVTVAAVAGCAKLGIGAKKNPDEAITERQALMKEQGAAMRSISEKLKAGQIKEIASDADKLESTSKRIPKLFPEGSVNASTSRAKPEIWQKWSEFEGYAKSLQTKAAQLEDTAKSGNAQATQTMVADLGKTTCGACHTAFRGPEIKK
jgi:cytochrome c556